MKLLGYALLAGFAANTAVAGGYIAPVVEAPIEVTETAATPNGDWTGFYAGLQYGQGEAGFKASGASLGIDGDAYGAHAGYQRDFGQYVLGAELDWNRAKADDFDGDADLYRLRARAGYDLGRVLPYVSLGVARFESDAGNDTGYVYGLGADFKVTDNFVMGAEFTRSTFTDVLGVDGVDLDVDLVQIRASYHF